MRKTMFLMLACCVLTACATTMPTVEEGWVPLDEWNQRIVASTPAPRMTAEDVKSLVLGSLRGFGGSGYGHYHSHGTITTRCTYGSVSSTCTTRY